MPTPPDPLTSILQKRYGFLAQIMLFMALALALLGPHPGAVPAIANGSPDAMVTANLHWQVHTRGISGFIADDLHGYPFRTDRLISDGFPIDALFSWPLCYIFGEAVGLYLWLLIILTSGAAAMSRFASRIWGPGLAGLASGVCWILAEPGLRQLAEGRFATVFAIHLLPLILFCSHTRRSPLTGILAGAVALTDPSLAIPALAVAILPNLLINPHILHIITWFLATTGLPLAWVLAGRGELPSFSMDPWSESLIGFTRQKPVDMVAARIFGWGGVMLGTLFAPLLVWGMYQVVRERSRASWQGLATLGLVGVVFGLGPYLPGPLTLPAGVLLQIPVLGRAWWSDRWWTVVALAIAFLIAGALQTTVLQKNRWLPMFFLAGLVIEPWILSRTLPMTRVPLQPSDAARVLANHPDVPLVLLPMPGGRFRPDRLDLLDQIEHGRPMANGTRPPLDLRATDALLRNWRENTGLRALLACEAAETPILSGKETFDLLHAGLRVVYVDTRYTQGPEGETYLTCIDHVLTGWSQGKEQEPFRKYEP